MKLLFLFLDGIGLGANDPQINPFVRARTPHLDSLLGNQKLIQSSAPFQSEEVTLLAVDPNLGVKGLPQSATGQAVLLTGINVPKELGYHYGPKPNPETAQYLEADTLFHKVFQAHKKAALLNAYPPGYFDGIESGKRLYSSIPLAFTNAGGALFTHEDYYAGRALSADFTGQGWRTFLNFPDAPVYDPYSAGVKLAELAMDYDFAFFEYWASDYAGHKQDMEAAVNQLENFDEMLAGLRSAWRGTEGLILLTSDHGNMEDLSTRKHTSASVPLLLIGEKTAREKFGQVSQLTEIAPRIADLLEV
ncbi:MAG: alkaline phosphatase family protein [Anaerolineales bacterium]|nr:alkaline phosphatase family protein [Anaerolineales bacterium]